MRLGPEEVCLRGERSCEIRAYVSAREGFVLGKGADGAAGKRDVSKAGAECYVTVPSLGDKLEFVDVSSHLTFGDIEMDA